jgi:hypothetical protein
MDRQIDGWIDIKPTWKCIYIFSNMCVQTLDQSDLERVHLHFRIVLYFYGRKEIAEYTTTT